MFKVAHCPFIRRIGSEQIRKAIRTTFSADMIRGIDRFFDHILNHVFVHLQSSLSYINAG